MNFRLIVLACAGAAFMAGAAQAAPLETAISAAV